MRLNFLIKLIEQDFRFVITKRPSTFYYQLRESRPVIVTFHESVHLTTLSRPTYGEKTFSINSENNICNSISIIVFHLERTVDISQ